MTAESGIRFHATLGDPARLTILQMAAGGVGLLDVDGDGRLDALLLGLSRCALYHNEGGCRFRDVTAESGLDPAGAWMGCAAGDVDGDGKTDLVLTGYHSLRLYGNTGGRFEDVTRGSGLVADRWYTSATFADVNGDGKLDLYVGAYVRFGPDLPQQCPVGIDPAGQAVSGPCGPEPYPAEVGRLYLNQGGGRFTDATRAAGLDRAAGKTLGAAFADYDGDGRPDLYLANDRTPCDLFHNEGNAAGVPRFRNVGLTSGTAYNRDGAVQSGMGVDWADVDNDGRLDLFVTTFQNEPKSLYHGDESGFFHDVSRVVGLAPADPYVGFGTRLVDLDNDGWLDLAIANGHISGPVERVDPSLSFAQPLQLFRNEGSGSFVDASAGMPQRRIVGRGLAAGDVDGDGLCDLLVMDLKDGPLLLHNETSGVNHWLRVRLEAAGANRQGTGARVTLEAGGKRQARAVTAGGSYLATSDPRLLFGLGAAARFDRIEVSWPDGRVTHTGGAAADRDVVIREAEGER